MAHQETVVIDDEDDDGAWIREEAAAKRGEESRPTHIDFASWSLIKRLRQQGYMHDTDIQIIGKPSTETSVATGKRRRIQSSLKKADQEYQDMILARTIRSQEEYRHRKQEQHDIDIARRIQEKENRKAARRANVSSTPALSKQDVLRSLSSCQKQAVDYVQCKAKELHEKALPALEKRVTELGFSSKDLHNCLTYIREDAPIVIHLNEETLSKLIQDTHYRNLFETNTSGGSNNKDWREKWEAAMFGGAYDKSSGGYHRPKYGCLNVTGDVRGVPVARRYGELYMIMHQHVRYRSTFFDADTGNAFHVATNQKSLATNEHYSHVLMGYQDVELKAALMVSDGASRVRGAPSKCVEYKEVQIHGPVCLATDVQALSVPGSEKEASETLRQHVEAFQKKVRCNILWQGIS